MANDTAVLEAAVRRAMAVEDKPSLLVLRSHIGWPSPAFTDTAKAHGSPFGADEVRKVKEILGLPPDEAFWAPGEVVDLYRRCIPRGQALRGEWQRRFDAWTGDKTAWAAAQAGHGVPGWESKLPTFEMGTELATRRAINQVLDATAGVVPGLVTGSADLTENTGVELAGAQAQSLADQGGLQVHYGIREHAMAGAMNGMALHGGTLPVGGTFFVFSDYMRPSVRLAALSEAHVVYFWTHDSVGLGEDGPTHQPVEHLAALRAMPGLRVVRPADANECAHAWRLAVDSPGPTALVLSRQSLPVLDGTAGAYDGVARGAYVLARAEGDRPDVTLVATGSEVHICVEAMALLGNGDGGVPLRAQVVSFPCWELFALQPGTYQASVLPDDVPTLAVEAAASFGWDRYADDAVALDHFGASAPGAAALEHFGFTPANVAARARQLVSTASITRQRPRPRP